MNIDEYSSRNLCVVAGRCRKNRYLYMAVTSYYMLCEMVHWKAGLYQIRNSGRNDVVASVLSHSYFHRHISRFVLGAIIVSLEFFWIEFRDVHWEQNFKSRQNTLVSSSPEHGLPQNAFLFVGQQYIMKQVLFLCESSLKALHWHSYK